MVRKKYDMKLFTLFITIFLISSPGSFSLVALNSSMADLTVRLNKEGILPEKSHSQPHTLKFYLDQMSSKPPEFSFRNMHDYNFSQNPKRNNETTIDNKTTHYARLYFFIFLKPSNNESAPNGQNIENDSKQMYGNDHKESKANLNGSWKDYRLNENELFKPQVKKDLVSNENEKADKIVNYAPSSFIFKPVHNGSASKLFYYKKQKYSNGSQLKNESQATVNNNKTIDASLPLKLLHIEQMHGKLNKEVKPQMKITRAAEQVSWPKQKRQVDGTPEGKSNNNPRGNGNLADKSTCNRSEGGCASPENPSSNSPKGDGRTSEKTPGNGPRGNGNSAEKSPEKVTSPTPDVKGKKSDSKSDSDSDSPYHSVASYSNGRGTIHVSYRKQNEMTPDHITIDNIPGETKVAGETELGNTDNRPFNEGENYSKSTSPVMKHGNHYEMTKQIPAINESSTGETETVNQTLFNNTDDSLFNEEKDKKQTIHMSMQALQNETTTEQVQTFHENSRGEEKTVTEAKQSYSDNHSVAKEKNEEATLYAVEDRKLNDTMTGHIQALNANSTDEPFANQKTVNNTDGKKASVQVHDMTTKQIQTLSENITVDTETIVQTTLRPTNDPSLASHHMMKRRNVNVMTTKKVEKTNDSSIPETEAVNQTVLSSPDDKNTPSDYPNETTTKIKQLPKIMTGQLQVPDKNTSVETETITQTKLGRTEDRSHTGKEEVSNAGIRHRQQNVMTTEQQQSVNESSVTNPEIVNQTLLRNTDDNLFNDEKIMQQTTSMNIKVLKNEMTTEQIQTFHENSRGKEKTEAKQRHTNNHPVAEEKSEATLYAVEGHELNDTMTGHVEALNANSTDTTTANQKALNNTDGKNASAGHHPKDTPNIKTQVRLHEMMTEPMQTLSKSITVDTETIIETTLRPTEYPSLAGEQNAANASYHRMKRRSLNDMTTEKVDETNDGSIHKMKAANKTIVNGNDGKIAEGGYPNETTIKEIKQMHEIMTEQVADKNSGVDAETAIQTKLGRTEDPSQTGEAGVTNPGIGHRQQNVMATEQMQTLNESSTDETNSPYQTLQRDTTAQTITDKSKIIEVRGTAIKDGKTFVPRTPPYNKFIGMDVISKFPINSSNRKLYQIMTEQLQVPDIKSNVGTGIGILTKLGRTKDHSQIEEAGVTNPGERHRQQNGMTTEAIDASSSGETDSANTTEQGNTGAQTLNDESEILETSRSLHIAKMAIQNGQPFVPNTPPHGKFVGMGMSVKLPINASNRKLHEMMTGLLRVPDMKSDVEKGMAILAKLGNKEDYSQTREEAVTTSGVRYRQQNGMTSEEIQANNASSDGETNSAKATVHRNTSSQTINDESKILETSHTLQGIARTVIQNGQPFVPNTPPHGKFVGMGLSVKLPINASNRKLHEMMTGLLQVPDMKSDVEKGMAILAKLGNKDYSQTREEAVTTPEVGYRHQNGMTTEEIQAHNTSSTGGTDSASATVHRNTSAETTNDESKILETSRALQGIARMVIQNGQKFVPNKPPHGKFVGMGMSEMRPINASNRKLHEMMTELLQVLDMNRNVETRMALLEKLGHSQTGEEADTIPRVGYRQQNRMTTEEIQAIKHSNTGEADNASATLHTNTSAQTTNDERKILETNHTLQGIARMAIENVQSLVPNTSPHGKFAESGISEKLPINISNRKLHEMMFLSSPHRKFGDMDMNEKLPINASNRTLHEMMTGLLQVPDMKSDVEAGMAILTKLGHTEDHSQTGEEGVATPAVRYRQQNAMTTEQIPTVSASSTNETDSVNATVQGNSGAQTVTDEGKTVGAILLPGIGKMGIQNGRTFVPSTSYEKFVGMGMNVKLPINTSNRKPARMGMGVMFPKIVPVM